MVCNTAKSEDAAKDRSSIGARGVMAICHIAGDARAPNIRVKENGTPDPSKHRASEGQEVQEVAREGHVPLGHNIGSARPIVGQNVPAGHVVGLLIPAAPQYDPVSQGIQLE